MPGQLTATRDEQKRGQSQAQRRQQQAGSCQQGGYGPTDEERQLLLLDDRFQQAGKMNSPAAYHDVQKR